MSKMKSNSIHEVPLSIVLFMLIIAYFTSNLLFVKIAFAVGLLSLLSSYFATALTKVWGKIIGVVGFINAHVLLSIIFFVILLPISLIYRLFNKDTLNLDAGKSSYYSERNHTYSAGDLKNPW